LKKLLVVLNNGAQLSSLMESKDADQSMDQFYAVCSSNIDDNCFEICVKDELGKLEHTLIPLRSILYVTCREHV
jgi:hypothetical protein